MRIQKNVLLIGGGAAVAVLFILAALLLVRGIGKFRETEQELEEEKKRWKNFYLKNPFPSEENVVLMRQNVAVLNEWANSMMGALSEKELHIENRSPTFLMDLLRSKQREFRVKAGKSGTTLSEDFAFGFDRYFADDDVVPLPDDVRKLTHQLIVIENLCEILFEERVTEIVDLTRDIFEKDALDKKNKKKSKVKQRTSLKEKKAEEAEVKIKEEDLYDKLHFTLEFTTRDENLWNVMNRIACHDVFMVVTSLEMHNEKRNLHPIVPKTVDKGTALTEEGKRDDRFKGVPRRFHRTVSGVDVEIPTTVEVGIDVYTFKSGRGN